MKLTPNPFFSFRKRYFLIGIIILVIVSIYYSNEQLGNKYNRSHGNRRSSVYDEDTASSSSSSYYYHDEDDLPSGLLGSSSSTSSSTATRSTSLDQLRRKLFGSQTTPTGESPSRSTVNLLTTTCNNNRKRKPATVGPYDNLWLSRSWAYFLGTTPLPTEVADDDDYDDTHDKQLPTNKYRKKNSNNLRTLRSSFRCSGDKTNTSNWRTRSCHYQNICYHLSSQEWRFYKGKKVNNPLPPFISRNQIKDDRTSSNGIIIDDYFPTLFHAQPSQMMEEFVFRGSSSSAASTLLSSDPSKLLTTVSSPSFSPSSKQRPYHGYVSLTTEPHRDAPHLFADTPVNNDWAPTLIDTFVPVNEPSTLYYQDLYQLYIPSVPLYDNDDDLDEEFLQWIQQDNAEEESSSFTTAQTRKTTVSSKKKNNNNNKPYRPSERPYCDPKHIQQLLYDIFGPLYAAKATLGLVTENDLTGEPFNPWSTDPKRSCDDEQPFDRSSPTKKSRGSHILLLDQATQNYRMEKLMYETFVRTHILPEAKETLLTKIHAYFANATSTAEKLATIASLNSMDIFAQCRNILPLLTPAIDILRESELLSFAKKKQKKNICFKNIQAGGTISYRFPERIWSSDDSSSSSSAKRTYAEALQQYPSLKDRNTFPHEAMDRSNGLVNGNILYSNINFHRIPLLREYRDSILLKYQLSPFFVPDHHQFVIMEEDARNPLRPTVSNMNDIYNWLHTLYPTVPIHRINLYDRHRNTKQWWENIVPLLLNTTILISNYGTLAQITLPFLPIGGIGILIDLPVNSPYYSSESVVDSSSLLHGKPLESSEFMENHNTEFSGISYFRSLTPDAPILNTFSHIQILSYQIRTYEDIIEQEIEVPVTEDTGGEPSVQLERIFRIKLRKEKLIHLVERGLHLWEQQEQSHDTKSESPTEAINIGRLYPHYGPEIIENE